MEACQNGTYHISGISRYLDASRRETVREMLGRAWILRMVSRGDLPWVLRPALKNHQSARTPWVDVDLDLVRGPGVWNCAHWASVCPDEALVGSRDGLASCACAPRARIHPMLSACRSPPRARCSRAATCVRSCVDSALARAARQANARVTMSYGR